MTELLEKDNQLGPNFKYCKECYTEMYGAKAFRRARVMKKLRDEKKKSQGAPFPPSHYIGLSSI